jgi:phage repressor protein C with HTH and peptisase S24 domain/transcriptional regulator with XRE-family HTH domain
MGLGKQIEHYRKKAGLTYEELEEWSGVASGTINALEKRDSSRSEKFPALARAFGLTVEQLADTSKSHPISLQRHYYMTVPENWPGWPEGTRNMEYGLPLARQRHDSQVREGATFIDSSVGMVALDHHKRVGRTANGMQPILAWEHEEDLPPGEYVMVPRLSVHLSAGGGKEQVEILFEELQPQAFRADWIRKKRLKPSKLASMSADGDSMEDRIHDQDALVVDTSQVEVVDGKVYALWYDGGERVKRLFRLPGGGLRIVSDNPKHPTIELDATHRGEVRIIGRVVHVAGEGGL